MTPINLTNPRAVGPRDFGNPPDPPEHVTCPACREDVVPVPKGNPYEGTPFGPCCPVCGYVELEA